jgi:hypothetical protein
MTILSPPPPLLIVQTHIGLGELGRVVHPYPTVANAIEGCAFGYNSANWQTVSKATIAAAPPPPKGKGQYCVSVSDVAAAVC